MLSVFQFRVWQILIPLNFSREVAVEDVGKEEVTGDSKKKVVLWGEDSSFVTTIYGYVIYTPDQFEIK